jgi:autotransporter-associated beta strand protein
MKRTLRILTVLALLAVVPLTRAGIHTWTGKGLNNLWSNPGNWENFYLPAPGEAELHLWFGTASNYTSVIDIPGLQVRALYFRPPAAEYYALSATGGAKLNLKDAYISADEFTLLDSSVEVALSGTNEFSLYKRFDIAGRLSGSGMAIFDGSVLWFYGSQPNTFSGLIVLLPGMELRLSKSTGPAIAGDVRLDDPWDCHLFGCDKEAGDNAVIRYFDDHQIANTSTVKIEGVLDLNGHIDTISSLVLGNDGLVTTGAGALTVVASVSKVVTVEDYDPYNSIDTAIIEGHLNLSAASDPDNGVFFDIGGNHSWQRLDLRATVSGPSGAKLRKRGLGVLELRGANTYSGLTLIEDGVLQISSDNALGSPTNATTVYPGATLQVSGFVNPTEPLNLNGVGFTNGFGALHASAIATWTGNIFLNTDSIINVPGIATLRHLGVISGPGGLRKTGTGTLTLAGVGDNTFSGNTVVNAGRLHLQKTNDVAIPGALIIGDGSGGSDADVVSLLTPHQIANDGPITVNTSGLLDLNNHSDTVASLNLIGGKITSGLGTLALLGNVIVASNSVRASTISGKLYLGTAPRVFDVERHGFLSGLVISANISGTAAGHLIKTGPGGLALSATNSYLGQTLVNQGVLTLVDEGTPGANGGGTIVTNGGTLRLSDVSIGAEPLSLQGPGATMRPLPIEGALHCEGSNSWAGNVTLVSTAVVHLATFDDGLAFRGALGGGALNKTGLGTLEFAGSTANTYALTTIEDGILLLNKTPGVAAVANLIEVGHGGNGNNTAIVHLARTNQIADATAVILQRDGLLEMAGHAETIGSLAGEGNVSLGNASLTTGGNNLSTVFSGRIEGIISAGLIKEGVGAMTLTSDNSYPGTTKINAGKLLINGAQPASKVDINMGATLGGSGVVGAIASKGGNISPGNSPGQLNSGNLALTTNSIFEVELNGLIPGTNCDLLNVSGSVSLGGAALNATLGFASAVSNHFTIIANNGTEAVTNTFAGLPEGARFNIGGTPFRISYRGGEGSNDVVLTQIGTTPSARLSGITRLDNGQVQLTGTGIPGVSYSIEANFDLGTTNWVNLGEVTAQPPTGALQFTDLDAGQYAQRFYRFVAP